MQEYRSDNFNYFSKEDQNKQKRKNVWKKVWFWIKIVLYIFLFGITLTGCVQSCTIKSSNYTGNGVEIYTSAQNVSPHVATFKANNLSKDDTNKLKDQGVDLEAYGLNNKNNVMSFKSDAAANFNLSHRFYRDQLEAIRKQTKEYGGEYGAYKNTNVGFQLYNQKNEIIGGKEQAITNKNGKYIFATMPVGVSDEKLPAYKYESIYKPGELKTWEFIDPGFNFDKYFQYDATSKTYKLALPKTGEDANRTKLLIQGKFIDTLKVPNGKKSADLVFEKPLSVLSVSADNQYFRNGIYSDRYGFGKVRRDMFETLANNTFYSENSIFYKKALEEAKTKFGASIDDYSKLSKHVLGILASKNEAQLQSLELSPVLFTALKTYTNSISEYANSVGFTALDQFDPIRKQIAEEYNKTAVDYNNQWSVVQAAKAAYDANKTDANKKALDVAQARLVELKTLLSQQNKNLDSTNRVLATSPNSVLAPQGQSLSSLPFTGETQRVIASWGTAWKLGPFYGLFVWPLAWVSDKLTSSIPVWQGWGTILALVIITIVLRATMFGLTFKSTINQSKQEDLKAKKAKIDAKYAEFKNNKQMKARQQAEVAELYKKNGINPLDSFAAILISFPVFIAVWRVIQSLPDMKSTVWLGMSFAETSWRRLFFNGEWQYLGLLIVAAAVQSISQFLPQMLNHKKFKERTNLEEVKALKKQNKTQIIMAIVMLIMTLIFSAGVQIYWIISGLWMIGQTLGIHYFKKSAYYRRKFLNKEAKI